MRRVINIILIATALYFTACQNDSTEESTLGNDAVKLSFTPSTSINADAQTTYNGMIGVMDVAGTWLRDPNDGSSTQVTFAGLNNASTTLSTSVGITVPEDQYTFVSYAIGQGGTIKASGDLIELVGGVQSMDKDVLYSLAHVDVSANGSQAAEIHFDYRHVLASVRFELATPDNQPISAQGVTISGIDGMKMNLNGRLDIKDGAITQASNPLGSNGKVEWNTNYMVIPQATSPSTITITYNGRDYKGEWNSIGLVAGNRTVIRVILSPAEFTFKAMLTDWDTDEVILEATKNININIPDPNFKAYLVENFDTNNDGEISILEARFITSISCREKSIYSLEGIQYFTALTSLDCLSNHISELDLSKNTALNYLYCRQNELTSLDVSKNTELTTLMCEDNKLVELNLSNNKKLKILGCFLNQITSLDLSNNTELTELRCEFNNITELNIDKNTELTVLVCRINNLTALNVENKTALTHLECCNNNIAELNVSNNKLLTFFNCQDNKLTTLDVTNNTLLEDFDCSYNQLTKLDVENNKKITILRCESNQLSELDISNNTVLEGVWCYDNQLSSLDVSKCSKLTELDCAPMESLDYLYIEHGQTIPYITQNRSEEKIPARTEILYWDSPIKFADKNFEAYILSKYDADKSGYIEHNEGYAVDSIEVATDNISSIKGVEFFPNLVYMRLYSEDTKKLDDGEYMLSLQNNGQLKTIDVSKNVNLKYLAFPGNQLTTIDLSKNINLETLNCSYNKMTTIDLSNNLNLKHLYSNGNSNVNTLDITNNPLLEELTCGGMALKKLDVSKQTNLRTLSCRSNYLTVLNVEKCTKLEVIDCYGNQISSLDLSHNTALTELDCSRNLLTSLDLSSNSALNKLSCKGNSALTTIYIAKGQTIANISKDDQTTLKEK